jgi:dihydropteroate synthase
MVTTFANIADIVVDIAGLLFNAAAPRERRTDASASICIPLNGGCSSSTSWLDLNARLKT